jgi:hypothetical protein
VVVVLLPLVPVIATKGAPKKRYASSISLSTGILRTVACCNKKFSCGTPGLGTT